MPNSKSTRKAGKIAVRCRSDEASEWVSTCMNSLELALTVAPLLLSSLFQHDNAFSTLARCTKLKVLVLYRAQGSDWTCRWQLPKKKALNSSTQMGRADEVTVQFFLSTSWFGTVLR
jgi:hypothetical protein